MGGGGRSLAAASSTHLGSIMGWLTWVLVALGFLGSTPQQAEGASIPAFLEVHEHSAHSCIHL